MSNAKEAGHMGWKMQTKISELNSVKNYNDGSTPSNNSNSSLKALQDWFWTNASIPMIDEGGGSDGYSLVQSRGASCTKINLSTSPETINSGYDGTSNANNVIDGKINVEFHTESVNFLQASDSINDGSPAASSSKQYFVSIDGGSSYTSQTDNPIFQWTGLNSGTYNVHAGDGSCSNLGSGSLPRDRMEDHRIQTTVNVAGGAAGGTNSNTYNNIFRNS